jgi:hypothetical protein
MGSWTIGYGINGAITTTADFAEYNGAVSALRDLMVSYADADDEAAYATLAETATPADYPDYQESGYGDDEPSMRATVDSILTDDAPSGGREWGARIQAATYEYVDFFLVWHD